MLKLSSAHIIPLGIMLAGVGTVVLVLRKEKPSLPASPLSALLPKASSSSSTPTTGTPQIQSGSSGPVVTKWQQYLISQGQAIAADGQFGPATKSATQAWQSAHGLTADGVVGPQTWSASGVS